jgi:hypothetical protein
MATYRKRPVVVGAVQYRVGGVLPEGVRIVDHMGVEFAVIDTLEGQMTVSDGDYVITGVKGERYPCKPDIFAATYEAVPEVDRSLESK